MPRLPGPVLDRGTVMLLAGMAGERDLPEGRRVPPRIPGWGARLGLTAPIRSHVHPNLRTGPATKNMQPVAPTPKPDYDAPRPPRPGHAPEPPDPGSGAPGQPAPDPPVERLAYSVDEAARLTGLSRDLLYDEMRRGNLPYVKVGRRRLITRQHLRQFLGVAS